MYRIFNNKTSFIRLTEQVPLVPKEADKINIDWETFIREKYQNWYTINGKYYYFKKLKELKILNNLILAKIVKDYYKLQVADYKLAKVGDSVGVASINFREKDAKYFEADKEHFPSFNPNITFKYLKTFFRNLKNYNQLVSDLTKLISFHIYSGLDDLCPPNLLFKEENDGFSLAPVFDLDDAFENVVMDWYFEYYSHICDFEIPSLIFTEFISNFPVFSKALAIQENINIDKVLNEVEQENDIEIGEIFKDYYKREDETKKGFIRGLRL